MSTIIACVTKMLKLLCFSKGFGLVQERKTTCTKQAVKNCDYMIIIVSIPWFWRYRIELERDKPQPITSLFRSAEMDYSIISFLEVVFDHKASQAHYHF